MSLYSNKQFMEIKTEGVLRYKEEITNDFLQFQNLSEASKLKGNASDRKEEHYSIILNTATMKTIRVNKKGEEKDCPNKPERLKLIDAKIRHFMEYQDSNPPDCKSYEQADELILGSLMNKRIEIEKELGLHYD